WTTAASCGNNRACGTSPMVTREYALRQTPKPHGATAADASPATDPPKPPPPEVEPQSDASPA
ncbi:hypothetical protein ACWEDZ_41245, partial [Streptomyces sp. NPDC005047]